VTRPLPHARARATLATLRSITALLVLALALSGCPGGDAPDGTEAADAPDAGTQATGTSGAADAAPAEVPAGTQPGQRPANFELPVLSGGDAERLALADLRGKVVILTFWASWCGPCRREVPALEKHWKAVRDTDVVVLGLSIDDNEKAARSFLSMFPVTYPMILDAGGGTVADDWGVSSIPATIVLDKDGVVRKRHLGFSPTMLANTIKLARELEQES